MAVAPELLLPPVGEMRPKLSAKSSAASAQSPSDPASSFASVLAGERQASLAGRQGDTRDAKPTADTANHNTEVEVSEPQVALADSGKNLPLAEESGEPVDPLVLLGLNIEAGAEKLALADADTAAGPGSGVELNEGPLADVDVAAEGQSNEDAIVFMGAPAGLAVVPDKILVEPEVEKLNSAASVQVSLDTARKAEVERGVGKPGALPGNAVNANTDNVQGTAAGQGGLTLEIDPQLSAGTAGQDVESDPASRALESLKVAAAESPVEAQSARTGQPGQTAIQLQAVQGARLVVPGQPLMLQQPGLSEAVVDRVMWLSSQNLRSAEIQLDPAELGRLDIRVSLNQDQATVSFSSPHAMVRDALESQMHRMRELFAQQGFNQLDVNVSDQSLARHSQSQGDAEQSGRASGVAGNGAADDSGEVVLGETRLQPANLQGLVDFYA